MFRWIFIPLIIGILVFSVIFFALPPVYSEADIVAGVSSALLDWSNRHFDPMPALLADVIARANLALIAVAASVFGSAAVVLLMLGWSLFAGGTGWLLARLRRKPVEDAREDLPPIEMHSTFAARGDGREVLGRGMDTLERD